MPFSIRMDDKMGSYTCLFTLSSQFHASSNTVIQLFIVGTYTRVIGNLIIYTCIFRKSSVWQLFFLANVFSSRVKQAIWSNLIKYNGFFKTSAEMPVLGYKTVCVIILHDPHPTLYFHCIGKTSLSQHLLDFQSLSVQAYVGYEALFQTHTLISFPVENFVLGCSCYLQHDKANNVA